MDRDLEAEHIRHTHLTTILGNAQLLRRWAARSSSLTDTEREAVLRQGLAIEQAARALQLAVEPPTASPNAAPGAAHRRGDDASATGKPAP